MARSCSSHAARAQAARTLAHTFMRAHLICAAWRKIICAQMSAQVVRERALAQHMYTHTHTHACSYVISPSRAVLARRDATHARAHAHPPEPRATFDNARCASLADFSACNCLSNNEAPGYTRTCVLACVHIVIARRRCSVVNCERKSARALSPRAIYIAVLRELARSLVLYSRHRQHRQ